MPSKASMTGRLTPTRAGIGGTPLNARNPNSKLQTISSPVSLVPIESLETVRVVVWRKAPKVVVEEGIIDHSMGVVPSWIDSLRIGCCCTVRLLASQGYSREGRENPCLGASLHPHIKLVMPLVQSAT